MLSRLVLFLCVTSRFLEGVSSLVALMYEYPPNLTIPSSGVGSSPASTASTRVSVNKAAGSKLRSRSKDGDVVFDFPEAIKLVVVAIVPSEMPCDITLDMIFVISRPAVNGFTRSTVT